MRIEYLSGPPQQTTHLLPKQFVLNQGSQEDYISPNTPPLASFILCLAKFAVHDFFMQRLKVKMRSSCSDLSTQWAGSLLTLGLRCSYL